MILFLQLWLHKLIFHNQQLTTNYILFHKTLTYSSGLTVSQNATRKESAQFCLLPWQQPSRLLPNIFFYTASDRFTSYYIYISELLQVAIFTLPYYGSDRRRGWTWQGQIRVHYRTFPGQPGRTSFLYDQKAVWSPPYLQSASCSNPSEADTALAKGTAKWLRPEQQMAKYRNGITALVYVCVHNEAQKSPCLQKN